MKKLAMFLFVMVVCLSAMAETININWKVDGTNYSQSTCQTGSNLILPATAPTKYGYVFRGWEVNSLITGTVKNLFDGQYKIGIYDMASGDYNTIATNRICNANMIPVQPSTKYEVFSFNYDLDTNMRWLFYDSTKTFIKSISSNTTIITPSNAAYINFYIANNLTPETAPDLLINKAPEPTNPVEPEFYTVGNIVLRALGSTIADTYDLETGKITRRVGVKVLDGTEQYSIFSGSGKTSVFLVHAANVGGPGSGNPSNNIISNEFATSTTLNTSTMDNMSVFWRGDEKLEFFIRYDLYDDDLAGFTSWIANQYANGTPVTIYYPLTMPTEENLY